MNLYFIARYEFCSLILSFFIVYTAINIDDKTSVVSSYNGQSKELKIFFHNIGKGLGKNENGLTKALKPTLKFDKAGIGYNENDSEQWWETLYDNAVKNIKVDLHDNEVCLSTINDSKMMDGWSIVSSKKSKMKELKYGNFLKSSTLHNGHLISLQDISMEKEEKKTAKDSVYNPTADKKLNKVHDTRIMATHDITSLDYKKCIKIFEQQKPKLFMDVITNSESQSDANLVKGNIMTHRETKVELDTEESEDPDKSQEMIANLNTSHENIFKSKKKRKHDKRRLNQMTQQFRICNLKRNNTDSKYISPHNKKSTRFKEEKNAESQLNVKSGKCSKKKHKNKQKKRFEQNIQHVAHETTSYYDIPNKLENTTKNLYSIKSENFNLNPVISNSNSSKNKINKDIYETIITLPIDEDRRNMNIKQEIEEEKTTGWEYFKTGKEEDLLLIKKLYNSVKGILQKPSNKKIKKYIHQQKRVKKQLENFMSQKNCTDDLNSVIKKLTTFDLTEEISANALKKKPTQTHFTPV